MIVLAAGGTAGHVEPALNLADELRRRAPGADIMFIGGDRGLEVSLVPDRGYQLVQVPAVPMPRRPGLDMMMVAPRLAKAVRMARRHLAAAQVVVGFGGYAALPAYLAARSCRIPLVIHEANARAGLANRVGARLTRHVLASHPGALPGAQPMALPLRPAIARLDRGLHRADARAAFGLPPDGPVLLVFGGSQGAQHLNAVLRESLDSLLADGIRVLHAVGPRNQGPEPREGYVPVPFIKRMDLAYSAADFALTRAGAMTCAELAAVGLPAAYVPLPIGNGEQRLNALPVVHAGGGLLVDDADLTAQWLRACVPGLIRDASRLREMSRAASQHGVRDAGADFAEFVAHVSLPGATGTANGTRTPGGSEA